MAGKLWQLGYYKFITKMYLQQTWLQGRSFLRRTAFCVLFGCGGRQLKETVRLDELATRD